MASSAVDQCTTLHSKRWHCGTLFW